MSDDTPVSDINQVLEERGSRYGPFNTHAAITQGMKSAFIINSKSLYKMSHSQREAVDMILHKLGRIGNGDPHYIDSWVDIVGYAQLVVDELVAAEAAKKQKEVVESSSSKQ